MGRGDRPELTAPPEIYYDAAEARKYTTNSRMIEIQVRERGVGRARVGERVRRRSRCACFRRFAAADHPSPLPSQATLTERALELLALPDDGRPRLLLDLGCGSGLSGDAIAGAGHAWVGLDVSPSMLAVAADRGVENGDLMLSDLGDGLPLRAGSFDGAVSISAVQWLCNADTTAHDQRFRLRRFFTTLYGCLARGARAVLQIYPDGPAQAELIVGAAMRAGFGGGLVVDFPNSSRARKHYLVLMVGGGALPPPRDGDGDRDDGDDRGAARVQGRRKGRHGAVRHGGAGRKAWIIAKKDKARAKGAPVAADSRYTGRKRRPKF